MYIVPKKKNLNNKFELVELTQNDLLVFKLVSFVFIYLLVIIFKCSKDAIFVKKNKNKD